MSEDMITYEIRTVLLSNMKLLCCISSHVLYYLPLLPPFFSFSIVFITQVLKISKCRLLSPTPGSSKEDKVNKVEEESPSIGKMIIRRKNNDEGFSVEQRLGE